MTFITRLVTQLIVLIIVAACTAADAMGQNAFDYSDIGIELTSATADERFSSYWSLGTGFALNGSFSFYLGKLNFHAEYIPARTTQPDIPDISNIMTTLGWMMPVDLSDKITFSAGFLIGNNFMYRRSKGPLDMPESEFTAGLSGSLRFRILEPVSLVARVQQIRIYTFHRINLTTAGIGLQYHMNTPESLKRFLQ